MMVLSREPNAELRWGHYSEGIPSIEPLQSRFHAAASKRIGAVLKSSLMLSTAARRAASIAFHRTASGKATRRQLKYQRTSKGKAMNIAARDRKSVVEGRSVSVRVDLGGGRFIKTKKQQ